MTIEGLSFDDEIVPAVDEVQRQIGLELEKDHKLIEQYFPTDFERLKKHEKLGKLPDDFKLYSIVREELFPPPPDEPALD